MAEAIALVGGECRVYNDDLVQELLTSAEEEKRERQLTLEKQRIRAINVSARSFHPPKATQPRMEKVASTRNIGGKGTSSLSETPQTTMKKTNGLSQRQADAMTMRNKVRLKAYQEESARKDREIKEMLENGRVNREKRFKKLYDTVFNGMESSGILAEIDHKLEMANAARDKKKEELYQEWKEQVYDHIHTQLQDAIDGLSVEEITKKHNEHYDAFLQVATKKSTQNPRGGVFRDVIIQSDYDPLAPHNKFLKINTKGMEDPLKRDLVKVAREKQQVGLDVPDYGTCPGKVMFPVDMYHQAEATPAGHFSLPDGDLKMPAQNFVESAAKKNHSDVPMEHYRIARGKAVMEAENPKGRAMVPELGHRQDRANFFNALHHTHHLAPKGETGGDQWLEAKGKRAIHAPGDPNRKTLYPVLNQLADHRTQGGHGDLWLSHKGKMGGINPNPPPGTRDNLFEVVNQSEGRLRAGFTSGDLWLEAKGKGRVASAAHIYAPAKDTWVAECMRDDDGVPLLD